LYFCSFLLQKYLLSIVAVCYNAFMIKCALEYCIYNTEKECTLSSIKLDGLGVCTNCDFPTIPQEVLQFYKSLRLHRIESRKINEKIKIKDEE
ncbi:MAG: hypothetical protein FWC82_03465, partial [Firmicutes bacterium]|nr:hypothetical protein [Bacillota bacterium]